MRVSFLLLILLLVLGVILWITLSGALLFLGFLLLLVLLIITIGYSDTVILVFLGAREVKSGDERNFHNASLQQSYKLAVTPPKLFYYNGALERAFVLHSQAHISLVLSKELLTVCSEEELSAICFELLLQVKKNLAAKRTKVMFMVGMWSWMIHLAVSLILKFLPIKELKQALNWLVFYFLHPWLEVLFKLTLGEKYFKRLGSFLKEYPQENDLLMRVGSKLRRSQEIYSLPSRKWIEISSVAKSRHYQNILSLEFLPHEWDFLFEPEVDKRA